VDQTGRGRAGFDGETDPVLRAKYVDFCSAQLTEVFLSLSDERIYDLVHEAARTAGTEPGALGFTAMVRLATQELRKSVPLPDFATWSREYREDPQRFESQLLGLWEELVAEGEPENNTD
jgi:hypothetical protein